MLCVAPLFGANHYYYDPAGIAQPCNCSIGRNHS